MLNTETIRHRICVSCRRRACRGELIRLTVNHANGAVQLNQAERSDWHGRSAYLCKSLKCLEKVLKGTRLKVALEGRVKASKQAKRTIRWPLEPQLIKDIEEQCTEPVKRCENTLRKESSE